MVRPALTGACIHQGVVVVRRIVALVAVAVLLGAIAPSSALAGVEPSPFHDEVNKLEAAAVRVERSAVQVDRLLGETEYQLPDAAVARQLETIHRRLDRDIEFTVAGLELIRSGGGSGDFPDALDATTDIRTFVNEIVLLAARSAKHPVYGAQAADLAALAQNAGDILDKYLAVELVVDISYDPVPYGGSQHVDIWVLDGWGNPWEGRPVIVTYFRPDYSFPVFQQDVVSADTNGYRSSDWIPDWNDPMVPGATIPLRVAAFDEYGDPLPHEEFFFGMESSPTGPGDALP